MFTVNATMDLPWGEAFREPGLGPVDQASVILVDLLTNGKFITIFSFLFGLGFFLQLERARARKSPFVALHLRRLAGLFAIGAVAIVCGLGTHILLDYAFFGLLLLFFQKRSPRLLLIAAVPCFLIAFAARSVEDLHGMTAARAASEKDSDGVPSLVDPEETESERLYREGTFLEIAKYRSGRLVKYVGSPKLRLYDLDLLGLMLVGGCVFRRRAAQDPDAQRELARKTLPWLLAIGASGMLTYMGIVFVYSGNSDAPPLSLIASFAFWPLGAPVLGLGYAAVIALLLKRPTWQTVLAPLASVGRLALTNYLFHAFVIASLTYSWGFGLYGEMGPAQGLLIVALIFPVMVLWSEWWIRRFRFGPCEWVWRSLTYGKLPPMRFSSTEGSR
jgi:uncharacterized protein